MKQETQKGFTLLETIVALSVLTIGMGGVVVFLQQTVAAVPDPVGRLEALYLAQEGIEIVRNIRDANFARIADAQSVGWLDNLGGCAPPTGCEATYQSEDLEASQHRNLFRNSAGFYDYENTGTETSFQRTIVVQPDPGPTPPRADVKVTVEWEMRGVSNSVSASTHIYNWLQ